MPINLKFVEAALARVESVLHEEETIQVGDLKIQVRPLRGEDEIALLEYASLAFRDGERPVKVSTMDFLFRIHVMTIASAIVQIGDHDLRSSDVETGVELPSGMAQVRDRVDVIREMILKHWTKPLITKVFVAVAETVARLSSKSADLVRFEPVDLEVEIKRCEDQLENLKKTRDDKASAAKSWSAKVFEDALGYAKGDPLPNINVDGLVPEQELRPPTPPSPTPPSHMQEGAQGTQGTQGTRQKAFEGRPAPPPMHISEEAPSELESAEQRILPDNTFLDESNPEASMEAEIKRQQKLAYQFAQNRQNDPRIRGLREAANTRNVVFNTDNVNYQNEAPHQQRWGQEVPDEVDSQHPQEIRRTPRLDPSKIVLNQDPSALPAPKNPRFTK